MRKIVLAGVMSLSMMLVSGAMAFAATDDAAATAEHSQMTQAQMEAVQGAQSESMKTAIANLLSDETLSEDEADTIISALDAQAAKHTQTTQTTQSAVSARTGNGLLSTLTEDQITALKDEAESLFKDALSELADAGTITDDQADAIILAASGSKQSLDLTDDQIKAVSEARAESMTQAVANLAADGTITDDESDTILAVLSKDKAETSEVKSTAATKAGIYTDLSDDQITALKAEYLTVLESALTDLTDDGTITADMATAILERASQTGTESRGEMTTEQNQNKTQPPMMQNQGHGQGSFMDMFMH